MDLKDVDTEEIIRRLREFAPNLPDSGFVAGGAVAALINHIVRGVNSPIRDVDLFLPAEFAHREDNNQLFIPTNVERNYYGRLLDVGYRVIATELDDKLNRAYCTANIERFESNVLMGFDINACQAGVSLSTGELFITPDFEDFLKSGQIYITNVGTPYRSACRLFKKAKDMSGDCNYYRELRILSLAIHQLCSVLPQQLPLDKFSFLNDQDRDELEHFFTIEEEPTFFKISVKEIDSDAPALYGVIGCTSALQFMAKIKARRNGQTSILSLLDEPLTYKIPKYLDNYRDVTLRDIEIRRDDHLAIRMGWNIRQHCQYSRHAQFTDEIHNKVHSTIEQTSYRSIAYSQQPIDETNPDINQNRTSSLDNTRQPVAMMPPPSAVTAEDILRMLSSPPPVEERSPLNQLRNNNLFGISLQSTINNCMIEHFAKR